MKKNQLRKRRMFLLCATLIVFQVYLIYQVSELRMQVHNVNHEIHMLSNNIHTEIREISVALEETLNRQTNPVETASFDIGSFIPGEHTLPVTFTVVPRAVSEHTAISLDFDGEIVPMERNGTVFSVTTARDFFARTAPMILIDENGVTTTVQDNRIDIGSIGHSILPTLFASMDGTTAYRQNTYGMHGNMRIEMREGRAGIQFTDMRCVVKVDQRVVSDEPISDMTFPITHGMDLTFPINEGQLLTITVIATDDLGFEHHYLVKHWIADTDDVRPLLGAGDKFGFADIYSADGQRLWTPEIFMPRR